MSRWPMPSVSERDRLRARAERLHTLNGSLLPGDSALVGLCEIAPEIGGYHAAHRMLQRPWVRWSNGWPVAFVSSVTHWMNALRSVEACARRSAQPWSKYGSMGGRPRASRT